MRSKLVLPFLATTLLLACANLAAQAPPADDGVTLVLMAKPGGDITSVANTISAVNGTVMKSTTIQATGQQILQGAVPTGKPSEAENSIKVMADPNITAVERNYYLRFQDQGDGEHRCLPNDPDYPQQWALPASIFPRLSAGSARRATGILSTVTNEIAYLR